MEEILREHGANGATLIACLLAGWRWLNSALAAYHDRTTAIREMVTAVETVAISFQGLTRIYNSKLDGMNKPGQATSDTTAGLTPP